MLARIATRIQVARNDEGATAVEYGLMVALIAAVIVGIVGTVGQDVLRAFTTVATALP
jgi:pilus assembly protein Flp/PilA